MMASCLRFHERDPTALWYVEDSAAVILRYTCAMRFILIT